MTCIAHGKYTLIPNLKIHNVHLQLYTFPIVHDRTHKINVNVSHMVMSFFR